MVPQSTTSPSVDPQLSGVRLPVPGTHRFRARRRGRGLVGHERAAGAVAGGPTGEVVAWQTTRGPPMQARSAVRGWPGVAPRITPGVAPRITPGGPDVLGTPTQECCPGRPACTGTCPPPTMESARARHPWSCRHHRRRDARPRSTDPPTSRPAAPIRSPCATRSAAPAAAPRSPVARSRSPCLPRPGSCPPGAVSARRRG